MHPTLLRSSLITALLLAGCSSGTTGPIPGGVIVAPEAILIGVGDTVRIAVTVVDTTGDTIPYPHLTFVSSMPAVARVNSTGRVTGVKSGVDTIFVSVGEVDTAIPVGVHPKRVLLAGRPFGIAVTSAGVVYITRQDSDAVARITLGPDLLSDGIRVGDDPGDVAFNAAGTVAYVTNFEGHTVYRISVATGTITDSANVGGEAYRVRLSPSGSYVYVTSGDTYLYKLNATTLARVDSVKALATPNGLALKGDTIAYVSSGSDVGVVELDLKGDSLLRSFPFYGQPQEVLLSADQSTLFFANQSGTLERISLTTGTYGTPISGMGEAFGLARTAAGDTLFLTSLEGMVRKIDASSGTILYTYPVGGAPRRVAIAGDGTVVVANEGNWVDIIR